MNTNKQLIMKQILVLLFGATILLSAGSLEVQSLKKLGAMLKEKTVESIEETIDDTQANNPTPEEESPLRSTKYDFVPGETVIFEAQLENEHNGEFPSKWDLSTGNVEIAMFGEMENYIFAQNNPGGILSSRYGRLE
jgi:hypothetical protein